MINFHWIKTGRLVKAVFRKYIWDLPNSNNLVYLSFDDGPTPEITPWVLDQLHKHHIKATFFCIGDNIRKHPAIFKRILSEGHTVGNHTFNHLNGWKTAARDYVDNVLECQHIMGQQQPKLFRPPYGRIKPSQARMLMSLGYKIIMWDVLTVDYDKKLSAEKCFENATEKVTSGSIIVFHDSVRAFKNLEQVLPKAITNLKSKGFYFDKIG